MPGYCLRRFCCKKTTDKPLKVKSKSTQAQSLPTPRAIFYCKEIKMEVFCNLKNENENLTAKNDLLQPSVTKK